MADPTDPIDPINPTGPAATDGAAATGPDQPTPPAGAGRRRWPRRAAIGVAGVAVVLGTAFWYLGRETTLQMIAKKAADASGGQIAISGVTGSLYGAMHIGHLTYRSPEQRIEADNIDIDWSPFQYFSSGVVINRLQVASLSSESLGPSEPAKMPASLAPPFELSVADARLAKLVLKSATGSNEIDNVRFKLQGDKSAWHLQNASASTEIGLLAADATIGATRPFKLDGKASLTQSAPPAGQQAAQLSATVGGSLELLQINANGRANQASGTAALSLAPFDPVMLRAVTINGAGIDPSRINAAWPQADLRIAIAAKVGANQSVSGTLAVNNLAPAGPVDQKRIPLQRASGTLGGTLTATRIDGVLIDLGEAGKFTGGGNIARTGPDAGIDTAAFQLHTDRIDLRGIQGTMKQTAIAGDVKVSSAGNTSTLSAQLAEQGLRLDLRATLAEQLLKIQHARLLAGKGSVDVTGQASLKDEQAFKLKASASSFNPANFGAFPSGDLNADFNVSGKLAPSWQVAADFALRPSRLFDQPLSGAGKLNADATHVSAVQAKLALGKNAVDLHGSFGAPGEQLAWQIDAPQLSALRSDLAGALAANGVVSGTMQAPRSTFTADARGLGLIAASVGGPGARAGMPIRASRRPVTENALHASGEVALAGKGEAKQVELTVRGTAQKLNPASFGAYPVGNINADFNGSGRLADNWRLALNLALQPSMLSNAPLTGYAKITADPSRVENADIDLHLGPNTVQARGAFGSTRDQLDWKIDAPQLASIGPQFGGVLQGSGTLSGTAAAPSLNLKLDGHDLRLLGEHQVKTLRGSASLGTGRGAADPLVSDLEIAGYSMPGFALSGARLQSSGTRAAHTIKLSARNDDFDAATQIKGGWNAGAWVGTLDALQNRGRFAFTLQAPVPVRVAGPAGSGVTGLLHPDELSLSNAVFALPGGIISVQSVDKVGARWRSTGQAAGVPLSYLAQMSPGWRDNASSDMTLGAQWSLNLMAAAAPGATPALAGNVHVFREKGDVTVGTDTPVVLGLRTLDARMDVVGNAVRMQVELDGSRVGQAHVNATAQLSQGRVANDSALTMTGSANMASLAWLGPLTGQQGMDIDGNLRVSMSAGGTVGAPTLNGEVYGDRLSVNWADQGVKLRNGELSAKLGGDQLQVQRLRFDGVEGNVQADGWLRFANSEATMQVKLVADKLLALSRPDRTLVISGTSTLTRDPRHFQLDGKFKAERALIELASQDTPTLSSDVVVLGKAGSGTGAASSDKPAAASLPLNVDVEADLGDEFKLRGKGLDATLAGNVRVRLLDRRAPRANGSIRVVNGTYAAYGQKLTIERGVINFTGAYDNPGLNILAVRKRPEGEALSDTNVEAGVEVRGTALAPTAKLVSTPTVPDSEKLAWLVLGHGTEGTASDEMGLLTTAAGALFGGSGGNGGIQSRVANSLGLDEIGLAQASGTTSSQAKGLETTVLTVGKRISQRAYLSFEQGASTASSLVKLRYKLNQRISLQFQTGVNSAFDILYTWAFD
jgi:translocation and assembly module TamB